MHEITTKLKILGGRTTRHPGTHSSTYNIFFTSATATEGLLHQMSESRIPEGSLASNQLTCSSQQELRGSLAHGGVVYILMYRILHVIFSYLCTE